MTNPFTLPDNEGYLWLRGNLHCHTTNSDGVPSPQERLDGYVQAGYDFLCLSDHRKVTQTDTVKAPKQFVLIPGAELHPDNPFGGEGHHFLCLNFTKDMDSESMPPQHVIDAVRQQGGSVWLAHPHWSNVNIRRDTLPLTGLAGVEVFNTVCERMGRGVGAVHWDDWMAHLDRPLPALANDDAHGSPHRPRDTYQGWTMARVKERTTAAVVAALESGATYSSTGPVIKDVRIRTLANPVDAKRSIEVSVDCSEAGRVAAITRGKGADYWLEGETFETATLAIADDSKWVRIEVVDPQGRKAWTNPVAL